jgi:hypothetical protein
MIAAMTTAIARRIVDRLPLLAVLVRCKSRLQSRRRDVVSAYVLFDMPTICSGWSDTTGRRTGLRLGGSAARRLGGSAARRLGGSAARRLIPYGRMAPAVFDMSAI